MERYSMFLGRRNQYCENDYATKCNLQIQCDPYQITNDIFHRTRTKNFTIHIETQKIPNSQSSLEKEEWTWRNQPFWLHIILQSYSHQDSLGLAQKQKYRPMEQNRKPRNKPMHILTPYIWQRRQEYATAAAKLLQSCPNLCDTIDGSPPGSSVPGILQARVYNGAKTASSIHGTGKTGQLHAKEWN